MIVTVTETVDGVSVAGSGVAITVYEGVAGDASGTAAAAVAAHVADVTDAHAIAGITGLQAALDAKAATTVTDDHETRIDALEVGGGGGAVDSVNGQTGVVVLNAADVGAAETSHTHAEADVTGLTAALAGKADDADVSALDVRVDALEAVDNATQAEMDAHAADTTLVHGIADTAALETTTGAQAKADAAQAAAVQRANHTGTQAAATISDLSEAIDDRVSSLIVAGTNITKTYDDTAGTLTLAASGSGGGSSNDPTLTGPDDYDFTASGLTTLPTGWSWDQQGASAYREEFGAGAIKFDSSGFNYWRGIYRTLPSGFTRATFKVSAAGTTAGNHGPGLYLRNSTSGKICTFTLRWYTTTQWNLTYFSSATGSVGTDLALPSQQQFAFKDLHFRIVRNSATSWDFQVSPVAHSFISIFAAQNVPAASQGFTPDQIGIGCLCLSAAERVMSVDWVKFE